MTTNEIPMDLTPDSILSFVQQERLAMLADVGSDNKMKLAVLNSIASTAIMEKKIVTEDAGATADREVSVALNNILKNNLANPFTVGNMGQRVTPVVIPEVDPIVTVLDETAISPGELTLNDIIR